MRVCVCLSVCVLLPSLCILVVRDGSLDLNLFCNAAVFVHVEFVSCCLSLSLSLSFLFTHVIFGFLNSEFPYSLIGCDCDTAIPVDDAAAGGK